MKSDSLLMHENPGDSGSVFLTLSGLLRYPSDDAVLQYLREGWFEYQEIVFVSRLLRQGDVFVDIGAHCGLYSVLASKRLGPNATIVSVEPNPDLHHFLRNNVGFAREVVDEAIGAGGRTLARAAVYTGDAVLTLKRPKAGRSAYASLSADFADDGFAFDEVDVHTRPLRSLIPDADSGAVTLIKLDTEGAEPAILAQGLPNLPTDRPLVIMIEFDEGSLRRSGTSSEALAGGILDAGYELYRYDAMSSTIHRFEGPYPLWGQNLFATRHADVIGARLNNVPADVFDQTQEFLERGRAADRLYKRSEQFDRLIGAIESLTDQAHGEWAKTQGMAEARRNTAETSTLSPEAIVAAAINRANDEFGRLASSLNWVRSDIATKNAMIASIEDAVGAKDNQFDTVFDHARGLALMLSQKVANFDALSSQVSIIKSDIGLAREDLAVVIRALSEMKRAGTEVPGLGATPVDTAIELAHRVKANLARAAQITEVVRQHAPDAPARPVLDTGSANTVELQNTIRRLTGELRHVNSLATELANSSWMKLGGRVGARAFTVLKSIVAVSHASLSAKPMATGDTVKPDQTQG